MCSKVSSEIETFEGAILGVGITKPTADLVKDLLGFMLGHTSNPTFDAMSATFGFMISSLLSLHG